MVLDWDCLVREQSDALEPLGSPFTGTLSWLSLDFEPDPYIKDLLYSIRQHACRSHRNPSDTDAVYSYGLTLQEIASKLRIDVECGWRDVGMSKVIEILELVRLKSFWHAWTLQSTDFRISAHQSSILLGAVPAWLLASHECRGCFSFFLVAIH